MSRNAIDPFFDVESSLKQFALRDEFHGTWATKHPLNVPGPIYVGDDCSCGTGPGVAPNNVVMIDNEEKFVAIDGICPQGGEFVYRQPVSMFELKQVISAGEINAPSTYALDGNSHWTRKSVVALWHETHKYRVALAANLETFWARRREHPSAMPIASDAWPSSDIERWLDYLEDGVEHYLREYCYFLDTRRLPTAATNLPPL